MHRRFYDGFFFEELVSYVNESFLSKWIVGISYDSVTQDEVTEQNSLEYDEDRTARQHCITFAENFHFIFRTKFKQLRGNQRAIIDWSISLAYEYFLKEYAFSDIKIIINNSFTQKIIPYFITSNDAYNLSSPWRQFTGDISYFGDTLNKYECDNTELFSEEDVEIADSFYQVLKILEQLNYSTNEGNSIQFTCCFLKGEKEEGKELFCDIFTAQYIKVLAGKDVAFYLNERGEIMDIKGIDNIALNSGLNFIANGKEFPSEIGASYLVNTIANYQEKHPDNSMFIITSDQNKNIYIYKNQSIVFCCRAGKWHFINFLSLTDLFIKDFWKTNVHHDLVITILDMAFGLKGGCLGIFDIKTFLEIEEIIPIGAIDESISKIPSILPCFWGNTREVRKKLLSIDGAVLISKDEGEIFNIGAIIPHKGVSSQGARTTATKEIARLGGIGIKISDDGYCEIYFPQTQVPLSEIEPVYSFLKEYTCI